MPPPYPYFERLLPSLEARAVEWGDLPHFGPLARLDNGLYFSVVWWPQRLLWSNVIELAFALFLAQDDSVTLPTLAEASDWLRTLWRYNFTPLGGLFGTPQARANLRRLRGELGTWSATMVETYLQKGAKNRTNASLRVVRSGFPLGPEKDTGPEGHDWIVLGHRVLERLDEIREVLGRNGGERSPNAVS